MKMWILAMAMIMSIGANAQDKKEHRESFKPEQRAELQAKKMTLALDLNEKQQKDVQQLLIEKGKQRTEFRRQHMADRQAGKKLTADERFAMKSKMLDDRIAMNREMKKILTQDQFARLEKMKKERHQELRKKEKNIKNHNRR
jgi:protein CpxP